MDYKEALKKVQVKREKEPFLLFQIAYDCKLVLPHKDGITFLNAMSQAEQLFDPYNEQHYIGEVKRDRFQVSPMSREEYERYKIAKLLGLTLSEVREAEETESK